jgi:transposase
MSAVAGLENPLVPLKTGGFHVTQTTAPTVYDNASALYMAMELSAKEWKLAFAKGFENPRIRTVNAGDFEGLRGEVRRALERYGLDLETPVVTCYEAGRDGFWIHRELERRRWRNVVVDPASIEVTRHRRKRKTDRLDAIGLVKRLVRYARGERDVWRTVRVPDVEDEDRRRLHREQDRLTKEQTSHLARIRSLLATQGPVPQKLDEAVLLRRSNGTRLPSALSAELRREWERLRLVQKHLKAVVGEMSRQEKEDQSPIMDKVRQLKQLKGVGSIFSRVLVMEFFGWRKFKNRREVGSLAGLTGTPHDSGSMEREQGISKAGNSWIRGLCVELAWMWVRWQPDSALTRWFTERFDADKGRRVKRIGIVALARKLLVALWKYLEHGELPEGAVLSRP